MSETVLIAILGILILFLFLRRKNEKISGSHEHSLDPVSAAILLSETDPQRCAQVNIVSLIVFEEKLGYEDFRDRFIENLVLTDKDSRFLYRLVFSPLLRRVKWVKAEGWDPFENCDVVLEPQTLETAKLLVGARLSAPLPLSQPLWRMQFISAFETNSGKSVSAVILTVHHSIGDGFTLCHQIMRRSVPLEKEMSLSECYPFKTASRSLHGFSFLNYFKSMYGVISTSSKLLSMRPDAVSELRNSSPRTLDERIISDLIELPFKVEEIKSIAEKAQLLVPKSDISDKISFNDIIVSAITLSFGELMERKRDVTSAIWVALNRRSILERPSYRRLDWGNSCLGTAYIKLPISESDPVKNLIECHSRLKELKHSPEPIVANWILKLLGSIPLRIIWPFRDFLLDKMSVSISNFPGPVRQIRFPVAPDGAANRTFRGVGTVESAYFSVAPPFSYGPYVTILSYNGKIFLALAVAERLIKEGTVTDLVRRTIPDSIRILDKAVQSSLETKQLI